MTPDERHRANMLATRKHILRERRKQRNPVRAFLSLASAKRMWSRGVMSRADIARDVRRKLYDTPARVWLRAAGVMRAGTKPPRHPAMDDAYALGPLMSFTFPRTPMRAKGTP